VGTAREPVPLSRDAASTPAQCDYVGQDPYTNSNTTVEVTVRATTPAEFAASCPNADTPALPGVGDAACAGRTGFALRKGTTEVGLSVSGALVVGNFETLAKTIASRL
jgi:hypothetical protein